MAALAPSGPSSQQDIYSIQETAGSPVKLIFTNGLSIKNIGSAGVQLNKDHQNNNISATTGLLCNCEDLIFWHIVIVGDRWQKQHNKTTNQHAACWLIAPLVSWLNACQTEWPADGRGGSVGLPRQDNYTTREQCGWWGNTGSDRLSLKTNHQNINLIHLRHIILLSLPLLRWTILKENQQVSIFASGPWCEFQPLVFNW